MKYYLATTGISEIWDKGCDLLVLGPWCLTGRPNMEVLTGRKYILLPSPWKPATQIKAAAEYCRRVYEGLLPRLGEALNAAHSLDYPEKYWRLLLGPWLLYFTTIFYDRFCRIGEAVALYPDFKTHVLAPDNSRLDFYDTHDFLEKAFQDYHNLKLFSFVIRALCPQKAVESDIFRPSALNLVKRSWRKRKAYRLINRVLSGRRVILSEMYHLNYLDMLRLKLGAGFTHLGFAEFISGKARPFGSECSARLRGSLKFDGEGDRFVSLLNAILPEAIPMCYLENYGAYREEARGCRINQTPAAVGSSVGWYLNEEFKFYAAHAVSEGTRLLDFQHGGVYGTSLSMPLEKLSLEKDVFYSWGWKQEGVVNLRPLPSAHLSRLRNKHSRKRSGILFVSTDFPRYTYRFHSCLMPDDMPGYFAAQAGFFRALDENIKKKAVYRPYFDYGWPGPDALRAACPGLRFARKGRLTELMKRSGIVVVDHPYTSFLEAMVINVPCVFYWDPEIHLMRPQAREYFEALKGAGILHDNPESASAKVNEIYDDPISWWQEEARQAVRKAFCDRYAYADKDWVNIWARELRQFL